MRAAHEQPARGQGKAKSFTLAARRLLLTMKISSHFSSMHLSRSRRRGFTLIEIMITVAIIAVLAAILSTNVIRARKRAQAAKVLDDLRSLDGALDLWALEQNKKAGDICEFSDLQPYLKQQNKLNLTGTDIFGQPYGPYTVDIGARLSDYTFRALSDVAPLEFWSPFY